MKVTLLHVEGCPTKKLAESRVMVAAEEVGLSVELSSRTVESVAEANRLGFGGSPTVLIDGVDVFPGSSSHDGLACRLYRTAHGLEGAPSVEDLIQAITAARETT
jgi:hypothetical protein